MEEFATDTAVEAGMSRRRFLKQTAVAGAGALGASSWLASALGASPTTSARRRLSSAQPSQPGKMLASWFSLTEKPFDHLALGVPGLSAAQLEAHLGLYRGYVTQVAKYSARIDDLQVTAQWDALRDAHLKYSYALNGLLLHDWYFSALGGTPHTPGPRARALITRDFGDFSRFEASLRALGAAMRGWVIVGVGLSDGKLRLYGLDAHDVGVPLGVLPVLVLDVYEHAYMIDYGTRRAAYLDVFWQAIDWAVVETRLQDADALMGPV